MQRDPWNHQQLKFDRRLEHYYPPRRPVLTELVVFGAAALLVAALTGWLVW